MNIRVASNLDEFNLMENEWNKTLSACRNRDIFLTWDWNFLWYNHYKANRKLSLLIIEDSNEILAIIPLMQSSYGISLIKYNILENLGVNLSDYSGIILKDENKNVTNNIFDSLASYIKRNKLVVRFNQIPGNVQTYKHLQANLVANKLFVKERFSDYSPYLPIQQSWEDYWPTLSKKFRKNLVRCEKLIEKDFGQITFRKSSHARLDADLDIFINLQNKKRTHKNWSDMKDEQISFLRDIAHRFLYKNWLSLSFLEVGGRALSCALGFEFNNKYYYYQPAFDPDYYSYSLGAIHIFYIIKDLYERQFDEFDFLLGDEAYKLRWEPLLRTTSSMTTFNNNFNSESKFKMINSLIRYNEIRKRSLKDNFILLCDKRKQELEQHKLNRRNTVDDKHDKNTIC